MNSNLKYDELYVDLLKRCVSNSIYDDDLDLLRATFKQDKDTKRLVAENAIAADPRKKYHGLIWPSRAHTMIGLPRLENLQMCVETVVREEIPGDFIETGVWRGGASIFMRGILKAFDVTDRQVWVADSFDGLPTIDASGHKGDANLGLDRFADLAVSLEQVQKHFHKYGLLDDQVTFLKGWFKDTLPTAPIKQLAIMRLDGDLYSSTMDAITVLYPKLSPGGFAILDDYNIVPGCNEATDAYREQNGITEPIIKIKGCGAFWRKSMESSA